MQNIYIMVFNFIFLWFSMCSTECVFSASVYISYVFAFGSFFYLFCLILVLYYYYYYYQFQFQFQLLVCILMRQKKSMDLADWGMQRIWEKVERRNCNQNIFYEKIYFKKVLKQRRGSKGGKTVAGSNLANTCLFEQSFIRIQLHRLLRYCVSQGSHIDQKRGWIASVCMAQSRQWSHGCFHG